MASQVRGGEHKSDVVHAMSLYKHDHTRTQLTVVTSTCNLGMQIKTL